MKPLRVSPTNALLALAASTTLVACAGASSADGIGPTGSGGSTGSHCTTTACLPPLTQSLTLALEVTPSSTSSNAAVTQFPSENLTPPPTLKTDPPLQVSATFNAPSSAFVPPSANVVVTVPSLIPGLAPLTFQSPAMAGSSSVTSAAINLPQSLVDMGSPATLALVPLPPADQQSPPYTSSVTLAASLQASIAADNFSISGTLESALGTVSGTPFVARAFQGGAQVSSAPLTEPAGSTQAPGGSFQLVLPSTVLDAGMPITVQLTPQSATDPYFVSTPIAVSSPLPPSFSPFPMPILLAPYIAPNQFNVAVQAAGGGMVSGALVEASILLGTNTYGSTEFSRSVLTGSNGIATLSLLPAPNGTAPIYYDLAVVPPANSAFGTYCISQVSVLAGAPQNSTATPPTLQTVTLPRRAVVSGTVTDAQGYPVANVAISATPGSDPTQTCSSTPAAPATTTTDAGGRFGLSLDPGTYQLDYDPPAGSAAPRLTEYAFSVAGGVAAIEHQVNLPAGWLVRGTVNASDGTPLSSATVQLFEPRCTSYTCSASNPLVPTLRGQAVTDASGTFRVAVALSN